MARSVVALLLLFLTAITICSCDPSVGQAVLQSICAGCVRYVKGFDITGVTNDVQYAFTSNGIKRACQCFQKCRENWKTCANWVWKYTDGSGKRTCTLYSNFNLPPNVTIGVDLSTSNNVGVIGDNPQAGGLVPHCQRFNRQGKVIGTDRRCISGPLWALDNNQFLC